MPFYLKEKPDAGEKRLTLIDNPVLVVEFPNGMAKTTAHVWIFNDYEAAFVQFVPGLFDDEIYGLPDEDRVHIGETDPETGEFKGEVRTSVQSQVSKESIVLAPGVGVFWKER